MDATTCNSTVLYEAAYKFLPVDSLSKNSDEAFEKANGGMNNRVYIVHSNELDQNGKKVDFVLRVCN
jgi:hypothetical protein